MHDYRSPYTVWRCLHFATGQMVHLVHRATPSDLRDQHAGQVIVWSGLANDKAEAARLAGVEQYAA